MNAGGNQASTGSLVDVKVQWEQEREGIRLAILRAIEHDAITPNQLPPEEDGQEFAPDEPKEEESDEDDVDQKRILTVGAEESGSDSDDS